MQLKGTALLGISSVHSQDMRRCAVVQAKKCCVEGIGCAVAARLAAEGARAVCWPHIEPSRKTEILHVNHDSLQAAQSVRFKLLRWILDKADGTNAAKDLEKAACATIQRRCAWL